MSTGSGHPHKWRKRDLQPKKVGVINLTEHANTPVSLKVLVVGDNGVLRRGIVQFLHTLDISISTGEASFESVVSDTMGDIDWNLIALDLEGGGDLTILKRINEVRPRVRILVLNSGNTPADVKAAFAAGASGYLAKNSPVQGWRDTFATVAAGGRYPLVNATSTDLSST
jgi:DNA-binding NarL/FixJ family response regulator